MHLKIENYYLKTCMEIRISEKVCENTYNIVQKLKIVIWKYVPNTS